MKNKKKALRLICIIVGLIILWFIAAFFFGPTSEYGINNSLERLRKDSLALQGDFSPVGKNYTHYKDIDSEINKIRDYGNPFKNCTSESDSNHILKNEKLYRIAEYNIAKCDSVLEETLPMWRQKFAFVLGSQLSEENILVRIPNDCEYNDVIAFYSIKFLSKDTVEDFELKYKLYVRELGFKKMIIAVSPDVNGIEINFNN